MIDIAKKIMDDENGATAIEYGIFAALVATAGVASLLATGDSLGTFFTADASAESFTLSYANGGGLRG